MPKVSNKNTSLQQILSSRFLEVGVLFLLFIVVYIINSLFPIYIDDWSYSRMMNGDAISGLGDIIRNQYNHYFAWGGRSLVHVIAQLMLYVGRPLGDILNTSAYILFIWMIYKIATLENDRNALYIIIIHCCIWFLTPSLGECIFWKTGSANYLWGVLFIISFLYLYSRYYLDDTKSMPSGLVFLFGILAGWTNENMGVALIFFLVVMLMLLRLEKRHIPQWMIYGLVGVLIGVVLMLIAPGNFIRYSSSESIGEDPVYLYFFYRTVSIVRQFSWYALYPTIIYAVIFILHLAKGNTEYKKQKIRLSLLFFTSAIVATAAMIAAPIFPERVWFGIITLMLVATMLLYANLNFKLKIFRISTYVISLFIIVLFTVSYSKGYQYLKTVDRIWAERETSVMLQKENHIQNAVVFGKYESDTRCLSLPMVSDLPLDSTYWMGTAYGGYLGVRSVTIVDTLQIKNFPGDSISKR